MRLIRIYLRTLTLLGPHARLAWLLALGNLALASTQFAEPVLFGRAIDTLTAAGGAQWPRLWSLLSAWVAFGLFNFITGTLVARKGEFAALAAAQFMVPAAEAPTATARTPVE